MFAVAPQLDLVACLAAVLAAVFPVAAALRHFAAAARVCAVVRVGHGAPRASILPPGASGTRDGDTCLPLRRLSPRQQRRTVVSGWYSACHLNGACASCPGARVEIRALPR